MKFTGERYIPGIGGSIALEHEHRYRFCLDFVGGRKVLDIACGEGFGSAMLAKHAESVFGVDIDPKAVAHAGTRYSHENLQFLVGSCSNIPLPDASIDVVVSFETIEHHDDHNGMMSEIVRVMRPGGVLIISSPDKLVYSDERAFHNKFHVRELYSEEFDALLKSNFSHVTMLGQRIVYGSALMLEGRSGALQSWGIDQEEPVSGLHAPMYKVAIASDNPSWGGIARSGILEDSVYRSEAIIERTESGNRAAAEQGRLALWKLKRAQADLEYQTQRAQELQEEVKKLWRKWYGSTALRRMVFHRSGKPRGWFRKLILKDKSGKVRPVFHRAIFKKNGSIRPSFALWYTPYLEHSNQSNKKVNYTDFLTKIIDNGDLAKAQTLHIVCTMHTQFIAAAITNALRRTRLTLTISTDMPTNFNHDLYIVVAPQMFDTMPPPHKLIVVQMEQVRASNWVDQSYITRLENSLAILDYSRDNIDALIQRGIQSKQIYYAPVRPMWRGEPQREQRDIDVLFYGATSSERRTKYLKALSSRVNIRVESNTFGQDLYDLLARSKVVANIHFYENALLETTRISEALTYGVHVVSEDAMDQPDHESLVGPVTFVPCDDVDLFVRRVEEAVSEWQEPTNVPQQEGIDGTSFHVLRALHGIGVISLSELQAACTDFSLPSKKLILALPEQCKRYESALRNRLPGAVPFHGLRQLVGWKGCAESYKFLAKQALKQNFNHLTIYEDDAIIEHDADQRLKAIEAYLDSQDGWDIFSGLLTDLHAEARIIGLKDIYGEEFIELDSVIGMVFGIYSRDGLRMLADFEFEGDDTNFHTIDRWLERRCPRTLTVMPPLAGHDEGLNSTLWTLNNSLMAPMIQKSINRLEEKLVTFRATEKASPKPVAPSDTPSRD